MTSSHEDGYKKITRIGRNQMTGKGKHIKKSLSYMVAQSIKLDGIDVLENSLSVPCNLKNSYHMIQKSLSLYILKQKWKYIHAYERKVLPFLIHGKVYERHHYNKRQTQKEK